MCWFARRNSLGTGHVRVLLVLLRVCVCNMVVTLRRAMEFVPGHVQAAAGMVRTYMKMKHGPGAVIWSGRLIKMQPHRTRNHVLHGDARRVEDDDALGTRRARRTREPAADLDDGIALE